MANNFRKGFYPVNPQTTEYRLFPIGSANGTNVFVGDVVSAITGSSATVPGSVAPSGASDTTIIQGVVVELFDNSSPPIPVGHWASSVSTKYLPASTAGYALIAVAKPGQRFVCQTNTIMNAGAIGKSTALYVSTAGSTTTSVSGMMINGNDLNTGTACIILGPWNQLANPAPNDITLTGALWIVEFNKGLNMGTGQSTGV